MQTKGNPVKFTYFLFLFLSQNNKFCRYNNLTFQMRNIPFLLEACPKELCNFYEHLKSLLYESRPNYELMRECLYDVCKNRNFKLDEPLDWEEGSHLYKKYFRKLQAIIKFSFKSQKLLQYNCLIKKNVQNMYKTIID